MKFNLCLVFVVAIALVSPAIFAAEQKIFYTSGPSDQKVMSLTFDDGPGKYTEQILKVLTDKSVRATFFIEGDQAEYQRERVKKILSAGGEIGTHTYSHPNFYTYRKSDYRNVLDDEIKKSLKILESITGQKIKLLRMPYGYWKKWVADVARENGLVGVNWTFGCDWKNLSSSELVKEYCRHISPGAIFLMHDGGKNRKKTVEALGEIISEIHRRGYKIVPVSELLGIK